MNLTPPDTEFEPGPEKMTAFERGWITGWLSSRGVEEPTFDQLREALLALLSFQKKHVTSERKQ
jgi:hypothetical protein